MGTTEGTGSGTDRHFSGTLTRIAVQHVEHVLGEAGRARLLATAGPQQPLATLLDDTSWSSYDELRSLLEAAAVLLGGPVALAEAAHTATLTDGSMPQTTEALQSLGSPNALLADLNGGNTGLSTVERGGFTEQLGPTEWLLGRRLDPGFEPFAALCQFHRGLAGMIPRMFGCTGVEVEDVACQCRGDEWCLLRLSWTEVDDDDGRRADFLAMKLAFAERRMAAMQATLAGFAHGSDDCDALLRRIVAAASATVRNPGFVLALDPDIWPGARVFRQGIDQESAVARAERALAGTPAPGDLVVEVTAGARRHGLLVAVDADGVLPPSQRSLLQSYGSLAAMVLDGALAVEEARRAAHTSALLLDLAHQLARVRSLPELARSLATIVPGIVGCDRAVVATVDPDACRATPVASHGFTAEHEALILGTPIELPGNLPAEVAYLGPDCENTIAQALIRATGAMAVVMIPVVVDEVAVAWISCGVLDRPERLAPSAILEERLHGLAAQASTAMHNALLLDQVSHQAHHDILTGLPNRKVFVEQLGRGRTEGTGRSVLFVDLDDFKDVNDGLGHEAGDDLLRAVADRLRRAVRDGDVVARLGGDEFGVLVADGGPAAGHLVARRVVDGLARPFEICGRQIAVSASVGVASGDRDVDELLRHADAAMYLAKAAGKGRVRVFEPGMGHAAVERLSLHADLTAAVGGDQLRVHFQPVFDVADGRLRGGEALVRWQHPELGLLMPDRFVGLAEDTGLILPLGAWVLEQACAEAVRWPTDLTVAVNLSARQLDDDGIVAGITSVLSATGLDPARLVLEVTESALARDPEAMAQRLTELRRTGIRIAVDDFGTGYSSLSCLVQLPVDVLKIDRSFVEGMLERPAAADLVQVLIDLGRTLGLEVIAEGVESVAQLRALAARRCPRAQGFLFAPPVPADEFARFVLDPVPLTHLSPAD